MAGLKDYETILNCMNEQVYARDLEKNILYVNPAAQKLSGWTFEEAVGKKCYEVFGDENGSCKDVCPVEKAIAENRSILHHEGELTRNGDIRRMKVSISPLVEDGNITGGIVVMQDITDFKDLQESHVRALIKMEKIQASLKKSELYLEQAQEVAGVGSWHIDIGADVLTWSEQTYRMFGVDRKTPLNVGMFMELVHPDDLPLVESAWEAALNGAAYDLEHRIVVNTETRWVHEKAQITFDNNGAPLYGIGTVLDITERKKADQKIYQANKKWERTFNAVSDLIALMDNQYRIVRINKAMADKLGILPEEAMGKTCYECVHGKDEPLPNCPYKQLLIDEKETTMDIFEERLGGDFRVTVTPIFDAEGKLTEAVHIARDITEQKRAEARHRFQAQIMSQIHDSVITTDMDGIITSWNKGSENLFYYRAGEIIGKHISVLYPEYTHISLNNTTIPILLSKGNYDYETPLIRKGGLEFSGLVSLSVLRDENDTVTGMIGYTLDITEREKARKALADSERRLNDIINFLPDPTWVIDIKGRVIAWNRAMARITGIDRTEIIGKGDYAYAVPFYGKPRPVLIDLVLRPDNEWGKKYLSMEKKGGDYPIAGEAFIPLMGDDGKYFAGTAARLYNADGVIVGAIESMRDITATKQAEQERDKLIAELQKALAKVRTLSGMLPICASCKRIRDDTGYWNQIESYIRDHSEADFSHGICPECAQKLYPDIDIYSDDDNYE